MTNNFTSNRLHASILWFGTMAALLSWPVALLVSRWLEISSWAGLTMAAVLATTFSSILVWWLFIVRPEHVRILRGVEAGIVSIIVAPFLLWCFYNVYSMVYGIVIQHQPIIGALLNMIGALLITLGWPILTVFFVCITPLGWLFFPIGGIAGGLLAWYLRRIVASEANHGRKGYYDYSRKIVFMIQMSISRRKYLLLTILGFGILAVIATFFFSFIFLNLTGMGGTAVLQWSCAATIAEGCTSMLCWYWFIVSQKTDKVLHGICAGLVSTFLAHQLMWLIMWFIMWLFPTKIGPTITGGYDIIAVLASTLIFGLFSFMLATLGSFGIMLLIAGGIGALYALFLRKVVPAFPNSLNIGINLWLIEVHCLLKFV